MDDGGEARRGGQRGEWAICKGMHALRPYTRCAPFYCSLCATTMDGLQSVELLCKARSHPEILLKQLLLVELLQLFDGP